MDGWTVGGNVGDMSYCFLIIVVRDRGEISFGIRHIGYLICHNMSIRHTDVAVSIILHCVYGYTKQRTRAPVLNTIIDKYAWDTEHIQWKLSSIILKSNVPVVFKRITKRKLFFLTDVVNACKSYLPIICRQKKNPYEQLV